MKKFSVVVLLILNMHFLYGQLSVQSTNPVNNKLSDIVQSLVGQGVRISNITSNQPNFTDVCGTFNEPSGQIGIRKGLLMTSGNLVNAIGPNYSSNTTQVNSTGGDPALSVQVGAPTLDACVIEFDLITSSSKISFNYVFASEEYLEYVGSQYNDAFGFFISGPGILGSKNIALVPGKGIPVSINNVNKSLNSIYYRDNGNGIISGGPILEYDGYTARLTAEASVFPCSMYHLKLVIADVGDRQFDSGVFIESGSLSGNEALMIGDIIAPDSLKVCSDKLPIELKAGINSLPNYTWTKDGTVVATGSKFYSSGSDGYYKVRAYLDSTCFWVDSIFIKTDSAPNLIVTNDTTICPGVSVQLNVQVSGGSSYTYAWSPSNSLQGANTYNPIASPQKTTAYQVVVSNGVCSVFNTVVIEVKEVHAQIVNTFPFGEVPWTVQFRNFSTGADSYTWYFESGATSTLFEPTMYIQKEGYHTVILKAINNYGCFDYDTLVLEAYKLFIPNLITPNGDGFNDTFVLSTIGNRFDVDIYNRWGDKVYKSTNYRNDWSGEGLSDGVYYYLIKDTLFDKEYKGWVQVIH